MKIWTLRSDLLEDVINSYINYVTNPYASFRQTSEWWNLEIAKEHPEPEKRALLYNDITGEVIIENLPKPQRNTIESHFMSMIHQIFLRYIDSKDGNFYLNTEILQKQYRYYNYMLKVLEYTLNINCYTSLYKNNNASCYTISYPENFHQIECSNRTVITDLDKCIKIFKKIHTDNIESAKRKTSSLFINTYNKMIKEYRLTDSEKAQEFIDTYRFEKKHSQLYYQNIIYKLKNDYIKEIDNMDNNGRIYHVGTQTPKLLKKYTNITATLDAKNSHPMLFNYLILNYYFDYNNISISYKFDFKNINKELYYMILEYIYNSFNNNYINKKITFHYTMQELCKVLENNGINQEKIEIIKKIPKDVFTYLYNSSHGQIWDEVHKANPQYDRDEIKKKMFKELFYSPRKNIRKEAKFATAFREKYPTIARIIRYYKLTFHTQCTKQNLTKLIKKGRTNENNWEKDNIQLAHKLMQLESCIYTEILRKLFKLPEFKGFGIHDAIVILDNSIESTVVCNTMKTVFQEMGLYPTFDIENYT